jgi:hypothetical protein
MRNGKSFENRFLPDKTREEIIHEKKERQRKIKEQQRANPFD